MVGQVAQTYIVAESPDGMVLVDQHAAHERVTYERLMAQRGVQAFDQQGLLIPQTLDLPPAAHALLLGNVELLNEWGFAIEEFGMGLRVRSVPAGLRESTLSAAVQMIGHLQQRRT